MKGCVTLFALFRERVRIVPRKESGLSSECLIKGKKFTPIYTQNRVAVVSSTESTPLNEIQKNIDKYFDVTYQMYNYMFFESEFTVNSISYHIFIMNIFQIGVCV